MIVERSIKAMDLLKALMRLRNRVCTHTFKQDLPIREYISTVFNTFGVEVSFEMIKDHFRGIQTDYDFEKPHADPAVLKRLDEISLMWPDGFR